MINSKIGYFKPLSLVMVTNSNVNLNIYESDKCSQTQHSDMRRSELNTLLNNGPLLYYYFWFLIHVKSGGN